MAVTITVINRTVNADGSVQYEFTGAPGLIFPSESVESEYCDQADIEQQMKPQMMRIAVGKTISLGAVGTAITYDVNAVGGNILQVS